MTHTLLDSFFLVGELPVNVEKGTYLPLLVLASYIVAVFGAYAGLSIASLIPPSRTRLQRILFRLVSALAYGCGFWSMHFVGMLAYRTSFDVSYNPWITALSLLVSVILSYFVLFLTRGHEGPPTPQRLAWGAFLLGLGICSMHYVGLEAMQTNVSLRFVPSLFFLSIIVAFLASWASLKIVFSAETDKSRNRSLWRIISALILGGGIFGAFYIGLAAAVFTPDTAYVVSGIGQSSNALMVAIFAMITLIFLIITFSISNRIFITVGCGSLFALPLVVIIFQAISSLNAEIRTLENGHAILRYHQQLADLLYKAHTVKDLGCLVYKGEQSLDPQLKAYQKGLREALGKLSPYAFLPSKNRGIEEGWKRVKERLIPMTLPPNDTKTNSADLYESATQSLVDFMNMVADGTNLSAYSETGKDVLLDYSIHVIPLIWETISSLRGYTATLLAPDRDETTWTKDERVNLGNILYLFNKQNAGQNDALGRFGQLNEGLSSLFRYNEDKIRPQWKAFSETIAAIVKNQPVALSSQAMFALATETYNVYRPFYLEPIEAFSGLLKQKETSKEIIRNLMLYSSFAAFIGFISLFVFLHRSLMKTEGAQRTAEQTQKELSLRLIEKERLENKMQDYTDRLELSRFDVMAANARLREEEVKIRAVMDNVLEGILVVNDFGIIQSFNKAAEQLFGYRADEVIGQTLSFLVPPEEKSLPESRLRRHIEKKDIHLIGIEHETTGCRKDGSTFPAMTNMSEVILGKSRLFIALIRDITPQKEKEEDLLRMKENAETANQTKSEFLANMSHELRTPLNSVFGMTRLLLETKLSTEQQELANTVLLSSTNLMEIVNDILDLSKIEAGEVELEHIGFDPRQVLHTVVRAQAHAAREKHVPIVRLYENETLPYLLGDPLRLSRILTNLLSNAIKYTDTGHIEVRAFSKKKNETQIILRCAVTDTGIGIAEDKLENVFDKFVQADSSTTRKYGGTGLGLAITRELVSIMGGEIGVQSRLGEGSTFWFTIPFDVTTALHEEKNIRKDRHTEGTTVNADSARVLVAEDHPMNQLLIKRLLDKFGIGTSKIAANGRDVLTLYDNDGPWTTILMDCHMPEKNGYDATTDIRVREKETKTHVPIIAMTANAMVGDKEKCLHAGMDEYISKPVNIEELKEVLSQWINFEKNEDEKERSEATMPEKIPPVDLTILRTLTDGDAEVERELMKTFVTQSDKNLETLRETRSAEGKNEPWTEAAHMLKGGSGSIGAEELRRLCSEAQLYQGDSAGRQELLRKIDSEYLLVKKHLKDEGLLS
ncbi:MAG: ATP-binding protein [Alphaproteobacteria bacterium]|nr:ATP-binding protein [Alphaproteobacteria bacterium]